LIDLYMAGTSNGLRASIALEECGLPYRLHKVDLMKGEHRKPEYVAVNPAGLIPTIVDHDGPGGKPLTLSQSGAILLYCAEKTGKLLPQDPARRALCMQWFLQAASDVAGAGTMMFWYGMAAPDKTPANVQWLEQRFLGTLQVVDRHLAEHEYLADECSVADLMLYPIYAGRKALVDKAGGFENLHRWGSRLGSRPGVAKGMGVMS
jgi:GSH-dependent disulfide-bond oxidoreductase